MNRLTGIRLGLTALLLVLLGILFYYMMVPRENQVVSDTGSSVPEQVPPTVGDGSLAVAGGEQLLYRDGKPYARLSFEEAIQDDEKTEVRQARLDLLEEDIFVLSARAVLAGESITFQDEVRTGLADGIQLRLDAPVSYAQGKLSGDGSATVDLKGVSLSGIGFQVDMENRWMRFHRAAELNSPDAGLTASSVRAMVRFETGQVSMLEQVSFAIHTADNVHTGDADIAVVGPGKQLRTTGKCRLYTAGQRIAGINLLIRPGAKSVVFESMDPVHLSRPGFQALFPSLAGEFSALAFPWASIRITRTDTLALGNGRMNLEAGELDARNPRGNLNGRLVSGSTFHADLTTRAYAIENPIVREPVEKQRITGIRMSGDPSGKVTIAGPVSGSYRGKQLLAEHAVQTGRNWVFQSLTAYDESWDTLLQAVQGSFEQDWVQLDGDVRFQIFRPSSSVVELMADKAIGDLEKMMLTDNVVLTDGSTRLEGPRAYVNRIQLSIMPAAVRTTRIQEGHSRLALLSMKNRPIWLFGDVELKENTGDWIRGGKLTYDPETGKISVLEDRETVKIKLHL